MALRSHPKLFFNAWPRFALTSRHELKRITCNEPIRSSFTGVAPITNLVEATRQSCTQ
jgi:hypothetical protein